ncbi:hypothetical protein AH782_09675 [Salmonella enterica subsp. enterica]|nr:hypothetical protein [Salmonella enterica subsp. enterica serovar Rubislaw]
MKLINPIVCDLIQWASDKNYPVAVRQYDVYVDGFANGEFTVCYGDDFDTVLISRKFNRKLSLITPEEFKDILCYSMGDF